MEDQQRPPGYRNSFAPLMTQHPESETFVDLWSARIFGLGRFAEHHWLVVCRETNTDRWEVWQTLNEREPSWGHLQRTLMRPSSGVGNGHLSRDLCARSWQTNQSVIQIANAFCVNVHARKNQDFVQWLREITKSGKGDEYSFALDEKLRIVRGSRCEAY